MAGDDQKVHSVPDSGVRLLVAPVPGNTCFCHGLREYIAKKSMEASGTSPTTVAFGSMIITHTSTPYGHVSISTC